ncbi:MAG: pyruvate:ferredoxin (flavodoxin) oxidoreductase [Lachnoclostridium sp.]|nr:pyruvate:ferredoxin (flavodoxin) oxidoreductase [Lachnospira sp.]MCM1249398.1 pyruvate:ferredoxin (flavodoxin) oxidoreductase [Lachnoclostridium sp.]
MVKRTKQTMDGNQAAAHVAYAYCETAAIYPITPSSPMSELMDEWMGQNRENIFGKIPVISQMQSEAGAAGAVHGALLAGALAVTFTSSQGLLLMLPELYRIAGELLPGVIHVAARTIATHALSIFGDHSDIYACRQCGAAIFAESGVQEVMDLSPVAHLSALEGGIPFINFFDGFRTSHELQKVSVWDYEDLKEMLPVAALDGFRGRSLHPRNGRIYGSAQNPDIFFQAREASNPRYLALPDIVEKNLCKINEKLGTSYGLMDYFGHPGATHVIIAMGSVCETIREYLEANPEEKYGLISLHLYRPFPSARLRETLPESVRQISVLNRTKEPGAPGAPLYLDVLAALRESPFRDVPLYCGCYGLSSKDTTPAQIAAVYTNRDRQFFTVGIEDDVTGLSLPLCPIPDTSPKETLSCKFWGLGGDGTISATKNIIKILGDHTDLEIQGYFEYDSKKSRGLTISHLRFGRERIRSAYLIRRADFAACHNPVYLHKYNMAQEIKEGGAFLVNLPRCPEDSSPESYPEAYLRECFPESLCAYLAAHRIHLYLIDADRIGKEIGLNGKVNTILQAAFFKVMEQFNLLPSKEAKLLMENAAGKSYGKLGEKIVNMNKDAIHRGFAEVTEVKIPDSWKRLGNTEILENTHPLDNSPFPDRQLLLDYVKQIQQPVTDQRGDSLPVSAFLPYADGFTPPGSSAHERRNVATEMPLWHPENCIQCNRCSYVCPHAVIRPAAMTEEQSRNAPKGMQQIPIMGMGGANADSGDSAKSLPTSFSVVVSQVDCTGCGSCAGICPGKGDGRKALTMHPVHEHEEHQEWFDYAKSLPAAAGACAAAKFGSHTVKGSQFLRPLMEFSGACAGCGETPYVKLLTQLFGPRMYLANATGCSSIWANSSPSTAYTLNQEGCGPAWSNSLFEDAAEFGFGMLMAQESRDEVRQGKTVQWVLGGDGWAYDIGFGGVDHVLASGRNINLMVLDTEVYSNTGGQASKATPMGSTARFVSGGKKTRKKDLASIAMTYGNVYVAQIAMGADLNQTVKAITEAAAYPGPSLVIAYATCIAHGIKAGMGSTQHEEKKAVEAGYYHLFRYDPSLKAQGKNPFQLDSKEPSLNYEDFLAGENRYALLARKHPEEAKSLFAKAAKESLERFEYLKRLEKLFEPNENGR